MNSDFQIRLEAKSFPDAKDMLYSSVLIIFIKWLQKSSKNKDSMAQGEEFLKARLEKDLAELKKMIDTHFVQRKKDEEEIAALETRIEERKAVRFIIEP